MAQVGKQIDVYTVFLIHFILVFSMYQFISFFYVAGYLLIGLTFMMLFLAVLYDIPQLNFGMFFLMKNDGTSDPEKMRLHPSTGLYGPKYTQHIDEPTIRHVKAMPHPQSSSPEDNP